MRVLLDASLDANTLSEIREVIEADPALKDIKWLMGRNAGRFRFVEVGIGLPIMDLARAESVIRRIEDQVRTRVPHVERVLIHAEPEDTTFVRVAVPVDDAQGKVSIHFGSAAYFALLKVRRSNSKIEGRETIVNPFQSEDRKKGLHVANWLIDRETDVVLSRESLRGKGPGFALGDAGVEIYSIQGSTLGESLEEYFSDR